MRSSKPGASADAHTPADPRAAELDAHFRSSFRVLWLIAAGIVGDASLAEDVVQEAALVALNKLDQYRPGSNFAAWAGQIVRNVAFNRARSERRRRSTAFSATMLSEHHDTAEQAGRREASSAGRIGNLEENEFHRQLIRALSDVQEIPRACLLLRTIEGLPYTEISRLLEIPEGTAMSHVHRTRQALRQQLSSQWSEGSMGRQQGS